jgi:hypothetical protein
MGCGTARREVMEQDSRAEIKSVLDRIIEKRIGYAPITSECLRGVR